MARRAAAKQVQVETRRTPRSRSAQAARATPVKVPKEFKPTNSRTRSWKSTDVAQIPASAPVAKAPPVTKAAQKVIHEALPFTAGYIETIFAAFRPHGERRFDAMLTPEMAEKLLVANIINRTLADSTVEHYAKAMTRGEWKLNEEAIKFDINGQMIDGQHRLYACIQSGVTIPICVALNCALGIEDTLDMGRRRTIGDNLARRGQKYGSGKTALIKVLYHLVADEKNYRTTTLEVLNLLARYPQIEKSIALVYSGKFRGAQSPILAAIHFLATEFLKKPERADAFIRVFQKGIPDSKFTEDNDPAHKMRERIINMKKTSDMQMKPGRLRDNLVHSWNYFAKGQGLKIWPDPKENLKIAGLDVSKVDLS